jgi:multiple sugar transport system permease protein
MSHRTTHRIIRGVVIVVLVLWIVVPFYFLLLVALQSKADSLKTPPDWIPHLDFSNFTGILKKAFSSEPPSAPSDLIFPGIRNSAIVAVVVAAANVAFGAPAAYALARFRYPGSRIIPMGMLCTQMVPVFALVIPFYVVMRNLGLTDTRQGVMIAQLAYTLPFTVWLLRAYFRGIPVELDRAARVDGCSRWNVFWRVVLPLARPGLISAGLLAFMVSWNDFLFPVVLNQDVNATLVQPAIAGLYNVRQQSFGIMAAGTLLAALPTVILALVSQRFLVRGLLSGVGKV